MQQPFKHLDLFSGIGGFALATEMVWGGSVEHVFCDIEPFAQAILRKHWPDAMIYGDIRSLTADAERQRQSQSQRGEQKKWRRTSDVDLLTGGFPCQPFSAAGKRKGTEDDRHLWPEMLRVIREFHPRWIIGENVGGLVTWSDGLVLEQVHTDLEGEGYEVQAFIIPACAVGAPHRRDRIWIVANSGSRRLGESGKGESEQSRRAEVVGTDSTTSHTAKRRRGEGHPQRGGVPERKGAVGEEKRRRSAHIGRNERWNENWPQVAARLCAVDDGLSGGLVRPRGWRNAALKGAGNAIVPQVAAEVMRAIQAADI